MMKPPSRLPQKMSRHDFMRWLAREVNFNLSQAQRRVSLVKFDPTWAAWQASRRSPWQVIRDAIEQLQ